MKPYIVCHMMQSVDGRIACDMVDKISGDEYYTALESLDCPTTVEGKVTLQLHVTGFAPYTPDDATPVGQEEVYVACPSDGYAISVDSAGTLLWTADNCQADTPRLCLVSERAPREYLARLRRLGLSYIATGKEQVGTLRREAHGCSGRRKGERRVPGCRPAGRNQRDDSPRHRRADGTTRPF